MGKCRRCATVGLVTKKMESTITKYDDKLNELEENIRFYLSTPERFAEALIFAKKLEKFAEDIKEKVKTRGSEIMHDQDLREIEFGEYVVKLIDPTETNEYNPVSVIKALGENSAGFMKVSTSKIEKWMMKSRLPFDEIEKIKLGMKVKLKKGYIRLDEKKEKEDKPIYIKE